MSDYGMPLSVGRDKTTGATWIGHPLAAEFADDEPAPPEPPRVRGPWGMVALAHDGGVLFGEITRSGKVLVVRDARKRISGGKIRMYKGPVFIPMGSVVYWTLGETQDIDGSA